MTIEMATTLLQDTILTALMVAAPVLMVALVVGLTVSVLQSATQINEQTLTLVPKIACVLGTFALLFPWIMQSIMDFATRIYVMIAQGGA